MVKALNTMLCQVSDVMRAVGFYRDVLGLTPGNVSPYWSDFELPGGTKIGLHPPFAVGKMPDGSGWIHGIEVDDVVALRKAVEAAGQLVGGYHDVPGGVVIDFADPDGNPIQAIQMGIYAKDLA
jgi:predicted enzyme related to lactoylglutathione lyase